MAREGLVAGEDLGPPSLRGMAGAELMGREGRSCNVRTKGDLSADGLGFVFFRCERSYDRVHWTVGRVG